MQLSKTFGGLASRIVPWCAFVCAPILLAEIPEIDITAEGPWSNIEKTTLTVPLVSNGSITVDGDVSQEEYGNFPGQFINPGDNGRIHNFPGDRQWDDEADSSFTFWLAHDEEYFYVGVDAKDDILNNDDPNAALWKDDSIEIVVDALNDRYDNNTDNSMDPFGGHCYISYNGKFSGWDDEANEKVDTRWSTAVEWTYGEDGEVWAVGKEVEGGFHLDVRFAKTLFEDPDAGNKLEDGYVMGFNIGMDDDDKFGPGANGDGSRTQDLELQYFWANRARLEGWSAEAAENYTAEQIANGEHEADFEKIINQVGRLAHGGSGEIIFSNENPFELAPGPNISLSNKKALGKLSKENLTYAEAVNVRNSGTENALTISAVIVTGPNSDLFVVDSFPASLDAQAEGQITFTFSPNGQTGDFAATLEIVSDDVDADDQTRLVEITASVVNLLGPIAHFTLDEAAGSTEMLDVSGNGRHGTFVGGTTLGEPALATGTALSVGDAGHGRLEGSEFRPDSFTVSLWMNASSGGGANQTVFAQGSDGDPAYALLAGDGNFQWFVGAAPVFGTSTGTAYAEGTAHHVAVSYLNEAPFTTTIYVDGVEVAGQDLGEALDVPREAPFTLGSFGAALPYVGSLDDLQIYDRVLAAEDVVFLRDHPGEVIGGGDPPVNPGGGDGLQVMWISELETDSGKEFQDLLAAEGHTVTEVFISDPTAEEQAMLNASDLVIVSRKTNSGTYNNQTWDETITAPLILMSPYLSRSSRWAWFDGTGLADATPESITVVAPDHPIFAGITVTDGASGPWHTEVDRGTSLATDAIANDGTVIATAPNGALVVAEWAAGTVALGQRLLFCAGSRELDGGTIGDAGKFNLTSDGEQAFLNAVTYLTGSGDSGGLDGYWTFDEGSGTTAADASAAGRDATFRNGAPTWTAGKIGGGLAFDGDDDLIVAGWKGISGAEPRAVSYWLKTDWDVSGVGGNIGWGSSETGLKWHLRLNENAGNGPVGAVRTEIQGSFHIGTQVVNDDAWHHIVSVFPEGGQFMQDLVHYVDGVLQEVGGTGSATVEVNTAGEAEGGTDVTFGSRLQGAVDQYYIGAMDDISIWSRALSEEEVVALSQGASPLNVAAGNLETGGGDGGAPLLESVSRTANGVAIGVPAGETYDIQYSQDLVTWETIANGAAGSYEDTDAGRTGGAEGYYRGVRK